MIVSDLETKERLRVELVDLPFAPGRSLRLRVNGKWAPQGASRQQDDGLAASAILVGVLLTMGVNGAFLPERG